MESSSRSSSSQTSSIVRWGFSSIRESRITSVYLDPHKTGRPRFLPYKTERCVLLTNLLPAGCQSFGELLGFMRIRIKPNGLVSKIVGGTPNTAPAAIQNMRVDHRGFHMSMAQQFLNCANIIAVFKEGCVANEFPKRLVRTLRTEGREGGGSRYALMRTGRAPQRIQHIRRGPRGCPRSRRGGATIVRLRP
jgi:hypothetical protein